MSRSARRPGRRAVHARGYTMMEVMMALALLTIGIIGIVAMQKTTVLANMTARNLDAARNVAATWLERLRADAVQWTDSGGTKNITNTRWLQAVGDDFPTQSALEGERFVPADVPGEKISAAADTLGQDTFAANEVAFCTHVRLTQLMPTMIRAEVRVLWLRDHTGGEVGSGALGQSLCDSTPGVVDAITTAATRYHFVYLTSAILRNDAAS